MKRLVVGILCVGLCTALGWSREERKREEPTPARPARGDASPGANDRRGNDAQTDTRGREKDSGREARSKENNQDQNAEPRKDSGSPAERSGDVKRPSVVDPRAAAGRKARSTRDVPATNTPSRIGDAPTRGMPRSDSVARRPMPAPEPAIRSNVSPERGRYQYSRDAAVDRNAPARPVADSRTSAERSVNRTVENRTTINQTTINRTVINETVVNRRSVASRYYEEDRFERRPVMMREVDHHHSGFAFSMGFSNFDGYDSSYFGFSYSRGRAPYCPPPPLFIRRPMILAPWPSVVIVEPAPVLVVMQPQPVVVIEPDLMMMVPLHRRWHRPEPVLVMEAVVVEPEPVMIVSTCAVYSPLYTPTLVIVMLAAAPVLVVGPAPVIVEPAPRYYYGRGTSVNFGFHYERHD
jgi:hypothetical protein